MRLKRHWTPSKLFRRWILENAREVTTPNTCKPDEAKENQKPAHLTTPSEAAEYLGVAQKTLSNWRSLGVGPVYRKIGGRVAYDLDALRAFIDQSSVSQLAEKGGV